MRRGYSAAVGIPARQRGFTLLEVMVALMLVGIGYTLSLSAMSGSLKLARLASEHENAMLLAKARLDEVANYPDHVFAEEAGLSAGDSANTAGEVYGGTEYSYKIEFRPVTLLDPRVAELVKLPFRLEEITIDVFWGKDGRHRYGLTTYRTVQLDAQGKPVDTAAPAGANAPGGGNAAGQPGAGGSGTAAGASGGANASAPAAGGTASSPFSTTGGGR